MENTDCNLKIRYRTATKEDSVELTLLFWGHLACNRDYLSHGELQMGIASSRIYGELEPDGKQMWTEYILERMSDPKSNIIVAEYESVIVGFIILEILKDRDKPYGVVNDLLVREDLRGQGIGTTLLSKGLEYLDQCGIVDYYLESGFDNEFAHIFYYNRGFKIVSFTFKKIE